jgi:UTP--glucose-1-phosphate uridylyltransferase
VGRGREPQVRPVRFGVVPAGGLGTRFLPITRTVPKELLPVVDTAVIELVVAELAAAGVDRVVLIVAPGKEMVAEYFQPRPKIEERLRAEARSAELELLRRPEGLAHVQTVLQHEAKGNGHAVLMAQPIVGDEPFAMLWGDDLMLADEPAVAQLMRARERLGGGSLVGCVRVNRADSTRYGMVAGTAADAATTRVSRIVEKPAPQDAPSDLAAVHGYILEPEIFEVLAGLAPGRGGEIWLTDAVSELARRGGKVWAVELHGNRYDAGDKVGYAKAFVDAALDRDDTGPALREHLETLGWRPPAR